MTKQELKDEIAMCIAYNTLVDSPDYVAQNLMELIQQYCIIIDKETKLEIT